VPPTFESEADRRLFERIEAALFDLESGGAGRRDEGGGLGEYSRDVAGNLLRDLAVMLYGPGPIRD
jgi:hypothetical protein